MTMFFTNIYQLNLMFFWPCIMNLLYINYQDALPTTSHLQSVLTQAVYRQATTNSHREWQYHMLHVHNCILLKMSTWGSKHVEENITRILWINNNQCVKLVINISFSLYKQKDCHYLFYVLILFWTSFRITFHICYHSENGWKKYFKTPGNLPCMQVIFCDICFWRQCSSGGCSCFLIFCNFNLLSAFYLQGVLFSAGLR